MRAWDAVILPAVLRFQPDLILVSAGLDAHQEDPFKLSRFSCQTYTNLTRGLCHLASQICGRQAGVDGAGVGREQGMASLIFWNVRPRNLRALGAREGLSLISSQS